MYVHVSPTVLQYHVLCSTLQHLDTAIAIFVHDQLRLCALCSTLQHLDTAICWQRHAGAYTCASSRASVAVRTEFVACPTSRAVAGDRSVRQGTHETSAAAPPLSALRRTPHLQAMRNNTVRAKTATTTVVRRGNANALSSQHKRDARWKVPDGALLEAVGRVAVAQMRTPLTRR